jgi:integrase
VWDASQAQTFLDRARSNSLFALFASALATGMRRGELLGLQWQDVDLDRGVIRVQRQLVEIGGHMELGDVKTSAGRRRIDLPAETTTILRELKAGANSSFVFADKCGKPLIGARVSRRFKDAIRSAGVPEISFHEMRHTHATLLLIAGISPKVVQERLGHSNVSITLQTYSHVLPSLQADAAAALNDILSMNGRTHALPARRIQRTRLRPVAARKNRENGGTLAVPTQKRIA